MSDFHEIAAGHASTQEPLSQPLDDKAHTRVYIGAAGNRLVADIGGDPLAPAVLLLHGGGQTRHSWSRAFRELVDQGYHVISLDTRGHGDSDWVADGDYSIDALSADLRLVAATLQSPPVLVGASLGGVTALTAQGENCLQARAIVLVDVAPQLQSAGIEQIVRFMTANGTGFSSLDEVADAIAAYNPTRARPTDLNGLLKNIRRADDDRYYWHWDPKLMEGDHRYRAQAIGERMLAAAQRVQVPVLLVRGGLSDVVSLEGAEHLRVHLPQLELADIDGAGHMVVGDKNDAFNSAILQFLQKHK